MMFKETDSREAHCEEVQDIIGQAPSWLISRGNLVIGSLILLLLAGGWFVRYPDIISAPVVITGSNPPVRIVAMANGRISGLEAGDGKEVQENQIIAVIDNPARTKDMLYLEEIVEKLDTAIDLAKTLAAISWVRNLQVGEVQSDYAALFQAAGNYNFFYSDGYFAHKLSAVKVQKAENAKIMKVIEDRAGLLNDQLVMDKWKDSVNEVLVKEKIISPAEFKEIRKAYLSRRITHSDNRSAVIQNQQQEREYQKSIADIHEQYKIEQKDVLSALREAVKKIKGQVAGWERQYVLRSPLKGRLVFFKVWSIHQYIRSGETVFMVVPGADRMEVRVQLPVYKAGKVRVGQRVMIKLREYPYEEFGMLTAVVQNLTDVSLDSAYLVQLKLENGLRTTRNRQLAIRPETTGTADIVTDDKSILQRIFETVYGKIHER